MSDFEMYFIDEEAAREVREDGDGFPPELKLIPMALTKRDGKVRVATALSCMCVTDPGSEEYGKLDMDADNPVGIWECNTDAQAFPGRSRQAIWRSWAPVFCKPGRNRDMFAAFRTFVNALLVNTKWADGRSDESGHSETDEEIEQALANVGETE